MIYNDHLNESVSWLLSFDVWKIQLHWEWISNCGSRQSDAVGAHRISAAHWINNFPWGATNELHHVGILQVHHCSMSGVGKSILHDWHRVNKICVSYSNMYQSYWWRHSHYSWPSCIFVESSLSMFSLLYCSRWEKNTHVSCLAASFTTFRLPFTFWSYVQMILP